MRVKQVVVWIVAGALLLMGQIAMAEPPDPLTPEERAWLDAHNGTIRMAPSPNWEPMEFFDADGNYQGLVADHMKLIEERLGFRFDIIRIDTWENVLSLAKERDIDLVSVAHRTRERDAFLDWTPPLLTLANTIIVTNKVQGLLTLGRMENMTIGVPAGYAVHNHLKGTYPDLNLVAVPNSHEGMRMVSFGELDAMIMEVPNALAVIESQQLTNLRLAGTIDFKTELCIASRNDWPLLGSIMKKGLALITPEEREALYNKWVRLEHIPFYRNPTFWTVVGSMFIIVAVVMAGIMAINRTLKLQVAQRTEELLFNEKRLEALVRLNQMTEATLDEIMAFALEEAVKLTRSRFGYLAFADSQGWLCTFNSIYSSAQQSWSCKRTPHGFPEELRGFWGEARATKEPVVSNHYLESNPEMEGVPKDMGPIFRYMNIPVVREGRVVVIAGVGNKAVPYDEADLRQVTLLMAGMWRMVQRRRAEEALKMSEKRFRDLVESSLTGISIIRNGEVVFRNPEQERMIGFLKPFENRELSTIHPDDVKIVTRFYGGILSGKPDLDECEFRFSDKAGGEGTITWVVCRANPIEYQGEEAVLVNSMDITRAKELERLLIAQDKMASLGLVSAGIAHEIRNPLSGINIYMSAVERKVRSGCSAGEVEPLIRQIQSASGKIEAVIRRVMNFSKPCEPHRVKTSLNKPVREALELSRVTLEKSKVQVDHRLATGLPGCLAEPQLIEEVVLNLVTNAAAAMDGWEGEKRIEVSTEYSGESLLLRVSDTGPGVPRDIHQRIFEPFFTTKRNSTGIGLSLCHRIITDHGGSISVEDGPQGGACFVVTLPAILSEETYAVI